MRTLSVERILFGHLLSISSNLESQRSNHAFQNYSHQLANDNLMNIIYFLHHIGTPICQSMNALIALNATQFVRNIYAAMRWIFSSNPAVVETRVTAEHHSFGHTMQSGKPERGPTPLQLRCVTSRIREGSVFSLISLDSLMTNNCGFYMLTRERYLVIRSQQIRQSGSERLCLFKGTF